MRAPAETILITGASSGIGLELARCFAKEQFATEKARLILVARNTAALGVLAAELRRDGKIEVTVLTADLSRPEAPKRIFDELSAQKIAVDVLVNNAGFGALGSFAELSLTRQMEMLQVNITALTELTGWFLPGMLQRKRGGILNVGSVAGFQPGPGMAVYYATKAFVLSFTEALAEEMAGSGLTISVLCPGPTETNFGQVARAEKARIFKAHKMTAQAVAISGHRAFRKGKVIAVPGWSNVMLTLSGRIVPRAFVRKVAKHFNRTED